MAMPKRRFVCPVHNKEIPLKTVQLALVAAGYSKNISRKARGKYSHSHVIVPCIHCDDVHELIELKEE